MKNGNEKAISLITRPTHKKVNGVMISGAISKNGLGHLIMHSGNINTFAYKQSLNFYKEDINWIRSKFLSAGWSSGSFFEGCSDNII